MEWPIHSIDRSTDLPDLRSRGCAFALQITERSLSCQHYDCFSLFNSILSHTAISWQSSNTQTACPRTSPALPPPKSSTTRQSYPIKQQDSTPSESTPDSASSVSTAQSYAP